MIHPSYDMSSMAKKIPRWLPGALISIALVAAILYFVDLPAVLQAIRTADYALLGLALGVGFAWLLVRGLVWRTLLQNRPSYKDTFLTLSEGYILNNFLPFRLGEFGRAFLLSRKTGMGFMEILPTIVIERVVDLAFSAGVLVAAVPFIVGAAGAERIGMIVGGIVLVGLALLYVLARKHGWALNLFHRLSARWPKLQRFGGSFLESFFTGLAVLTDGRRFSLFLFWMASDWLLAVIEYYLLILAFFPQAQPVWGMFGLGAAAFGGAIPSLPGAVGTFEGAFGGALTLLSGDQSTALAVALTARLYNYLFTSIFGGYALSREGQTLAGVYRQLVELRSKSEMNDG